MSKNNNFRILERLTLPVQLLLAIAFVVLFGNLLPLSVVRGIYTFSLFFKEVLSFSLPFIIFTFVLSGIVSLKKNAPFVLLILLSSIFVSNFVIALSMYGIMGLLLPYFASHGAEFHELVQNTTILEPLATWSLPALVRSEVALVTAICIGLVFSFCQSTRAEQLVEKMRHALEYFLWHWFVPFLPLYVLGFLLKLWHEGALLHIAKDYGTTFFIIVFIQMIFLYIAYSIATGFSFHRTKEAIVNALPSYVTAFSTMSSTLTVPVSIESAIKNTGSRPLANIAMPIMANVHLLGDSIATPTLAMVTLYLFSGTIPSLAHYLSFVFYFCTAMFAVSGIPGGGILVMIPVLVSMFDFTPSMISIITMLYFLLDPFGTAANVMGDGALVMIVHRFVRRFV